MISFQNLSDQTKGRLLVLFAAILWSTSGLILKSQAIQSIEPYGERGYLVACWRAFFAALGVALFVDWKKARWRPALIPLTILFASMNLVYVAAMSSETDAGNVIFLQYLAPLWVLIASIIWLKESLVKSNIYALIFATAGVLVIASSVFNTPQFFGSVLALIAGITYAGVIVCLRYLKDEDSFWLIFLCFLVSWVVLLPYTETFDQRFEGSAWYWVFFMGTFQMAGAYSCFALGVKFITAQEGSLIALLEPILNPIWVLLIWGIAIDDKTIIGASLISAGLILRYRIGDEKIEVNQS